MLNAAPEFQKLKNEVGETKVEVRKIAENQNEFLNRPQPSAEVQNDFQKRPGRLSKFRRSKRIMSPQAQEHVNLKGKAWLDEIQR